MFANPRATGARGKRGRSRRPYRAPGGLLYEGLEVACGVGGGACGGFPGSARECAQGTAKLDWGGPASRQRRRGAAATANTRAVEWLVSVGAQRRAGLCCGLEHDDVVRAADAKRTVGHGSSRMWRLTRCSLTYCAPSCSCRSDTRRVRAVCASSRCGRRAAGRGEQDLRAVSVRVGLKASVRNGNRGGSSQEAMQTVMLRAKPWGGLK